VEFGPNFDPAALDAFIHLIAPLEKKEPEKPQPEPALEKPITSIAVEETESAERFTFSTEPEPVMETARGVTRDGRPSAETTPRSPSTRRGSVTVGGMEFMLVPQGRFVMGSKDDDKDADSYEKPQHTVEIPYDYYLARFTVTNEQYNAFIKATNGEHPVSGWKKKADHPVVNVFWQDAMEYVKWLNTSLGSPQTGLIFRLPTEAEWEKAARGAYGSLYPWGNDFKPKRCNSAQGGQGGTAPVSAYPNGASPYGCEQMAGNVLEWTRSLFKDYPYNARDGRENEKDISDYCVARGGSFVNDRQSVRCAFRYHGGPNFRIGTQGFRVALAPPLK
jgi:formylglycine-generating enzyme required for sulfatase activity